MPSSFPGSLDNIAADKTDNTPTGGDHAAHHNAMADAINATQEHILDSVATRDEAVLRSMTQAGTLPAPTSEVVLNHQSVDPARGAFRLTIVGARFNNEVDPVMYLGYNMGFGAAGPKANEASLGLAIEGHYDDGVNDTMELYVESYANDHTTSIRPFFFQVKKNATTRQAMLTSAQIMGNPLRVVDPDSVLIAQFGDDGPQNIIFAGAQKWQTRPGGVEYATLTEAAVLSLLGTGQVILTNTVGNVVFQTRRVGDASARFYITADGGHTWDGAVTLERDGGTLDMHLTGADLRFITASTGPIIKSPDGTSYRIVVANGGALSAVAAP